MIEFEDNLKILGVYNFNVLIVFTSNTMFSVQGEFYIINSKIEFNNFVNLFFSLKVPDNYLLVQGSTGEVLAVFGEANAANAIRMTS